MAYFPRGGVAAVSARRKSAIARGKVEDVQRRILSLANQRAARRDGGKGEGGDSHI